MRQIKFRVWIRERWVGPIMQEAYMAKQGDPDLETLQSFMYHYGDQELLMQFTGLTDKNGKEIYEGDVVRWDDFSKGKYWRVAVVFYDDTLAVYSFRIVKNTMHPLSAKEGYVFGQNFAYRNGKHLEIIGNIYENPELLARITTPNY